ncbi:MAG TPA: hypothetical protein VF837_00500 [Patescibacteria group bacterium]
MNWLLFPVYITNEIWLLFRNRIYYKGPLNPPKSWKTGYKGDVILIHGLNGRWVSLKKIGDAARELGFKVHIIKALGYNLKSIPEGAADISEYIKKNNLKNVTLIGHSKGALNAIYVLKDPEIDQIVRKVIIIAGPLKGLFLSRFTPTAGELDSESDFMKQYKKGIDSKKIVNIYPSVDDMVIPNASLQWEEVMNMKIDIYGHIRVVEADETIKEIVSILNSLPS